ncbi:hypothetical protein ACF09K_15155 [Streptomyces sp. NPDC014882]|uniref:hypothetical protein n=1 Tax=Streptomyces sp. NPDC014882 TaxID=3364927 RepID=UPI0036FF011D
MIYRHHIAPPRAFTQFSHDLIRHPRLSSDAVRLLTWQLSLPEGARDSLSRTAERARIRATAFTRAKRQLKDEGFVHERRVQGPGGHWVTQQLVSNVPLNSAEAAKLLARTPVGPGGDIIGERVSPQVAPSRRHPAVGEPTAPLSDGHPDADTRRDTSHRPPEPPERTAPVAAEPAPPARPVAGTERFLGEAHALASGYRDLDPALRGIPRAMDAELTDLTARWLEAGHPPTAIRAYILRGLPDDDTAVRRPGGLLRHLLREVPPAPVPTPPVSTADALPSAPPAPPTGPRLSDRLTGTRECEGRHIQTRLFRPTDEETLCPECATHPAPPALPVSDGPTDQASETGAPADVRASRQRFFRVTASGEGDRHGGRLRVP